MRNLSLLFLLLLLGIVGCQSSKTSKTSNPIIQAEGKGTSKPNPFYKSFAQFNGDTLQYLNYNFVEHKDQYIGKPFSVLYQDQEFPVKSSTYGTDAHNALASHDISLSFYDDGTTNYLMNSDEGYCYFVIVKWEKPIARDKLDKLDMANDGNWTPEHEILVNKEIIKDVAVLKYVNPQSKKQ